MRDANLGSIIYCLALAAAPLVSGCSSDKGSSDDAAGDAADGDGDADGTGDAGDGDADGDADGGEGSGVAENCGTDRPGALVACVDGSRYQTDLEAIASPREPGSAHWQTVQDLCADRLEGLGFTVEREDYGTGTNVIGTKAGTAGGDEYVILSAHYDHIDGCVGADDNASGVAGMLEAARVLAQRDYPRNLVVACWDQEEFGLLGARAYAQAASARGDEVVFNFNYEMIGYVSDEPNSQSIPTGLDALFPQQAGEIEADDFRANFIALIVNKRGVAHMEAMAHWADLLGLPNQILDVPDDAKNSPLLSDLRRSDHATFWEVDYDAAMITDTSEFRYDAYHCRNGLEDVVENLDNEFSTAVIKASVGAIAESLGLERAN